MNKLLLSCLLVMIHTSVQGTQYVEMKQLHALEVIPVHISFRAGEFAEGTLSYVGSSHCANNVHDAYGKQLKVAANDVWVPIRPGLQKEKEWLREQLPAYLPLSLFKGKKEGDSVSLVMSFKNWYVQGRLFEIKFLLREGFNNLPQLVKDFAQRPQFAQCDEKALLQAGVLSQIQLLKRVIY